MMFFHDTFVPIPRLTDDYVDFMRRNHPTILLDVLLRAINWSISQYSYFGRHPALLNTRAMLLLVSNISALTFKQYAQDAQDMARGCLYMIIDQNNFTFLNDTGCTICKPLLDFLGQVVGGKTLKQQNVNQSKSSLQKMVREEEGNYKKASTRTEKYRCLQRIMSGHYPLFVLAKESNDPYLVAYAINVASIYRRMNKPRQAFYVLFYLAYQNLGADFKKLRSSVIQAMTDTLAEWNSVIVSYYRLAEKSQNPHITYQLADYFWLDALQLLEGNNLTADFTDAMYSLNKNIACAAVKLDDPSKATTYFNKALEYADDDQRKYIENRLSGLPEIGVSALPE